MCVRCAGATQEQALEQVLCTIGRYGWAVQAVEGDRVHPPWAYTVGLHLRGRPELVVTGLPARHAAELLDGVAAHLLHSETPPEPGERVPLHEGPVVEFVALPHPDAHLNVAVTLLGPEIRALQMVWADERGHWPWDPGFRAARGARGGQPVLGPRAPGAPEARRRNR
ncbi:DUF4262 domain-containing protein [Pseudonocardia sp. RS010]|uniref:DUF4262 domain-containing protein n=1 Tax=Pseudonocardia sp. RS010 TaxID=3385979 RepID=UPI0039A10A28